MTTETLSSLPTGLDSRINYGKLTLLQLAEWIVNNSDQGASKELHEERRLFHYKDKQKLRLVDYIAALAQSALARRWCGYNDMILDEAYSLTVSKFYSIPTDAAKGQHPGPHGPDSRYYFKTFIKCAKDRLREEAPANATEAEIISAQILCGLVTWHFYLSCRESKRRAYRLVRRYVWKLDGGTLYIWIPFEIPGQHCREWLKANISDVDPHRLGEQDRVQAIVDRLLGKRTVFYLSELERTGERLPPSPCSPPSIIEEQISVAGLADAVACEKAENIERQRLAIRLLGGDKLKELIRTIFTRLACGKYVEKDIAGRFELSRATMSRFAGSRWQGPCDNAQANIVPDLWRNVAHTLGGHSDFVTAAQKAGVWKQVSDVLHIKNKTRRT